MINNTVIIIKKRIGGKYATLLGDFALESSEKLNLIFLKNQKCAMQGEDFCRLVEKHLAK